MSNQSDGYVSMEQIIFEQGKDPGEGYLRIVGNFDKMGKVASNRDISFKEIHEVMFSKGRSAFLEEYMEIKKSGDHEVSERQFRIVGLTLSGRPLLVVFTPRDKGFAKRIITAWQVGKDSDELKKLLEKCPNLDGHIRIA